MLVFKETAQVLDQAAALVNAKVNELRDKENIPPPDLLENNEKPLETPKKRYIAPKGVERKPLSILLDEDTDDENSVQEDNNDGHFVVLQVSVLKDQTFYIFYLFMINIHIYSLVWHLLQENSYPMKRSWKSPRK